MVDDDRAQCPEARFKKIQQAVDEAAAGDTVQVCPGLYVERVVVDKELTLRGMSPAVEPDACLATTASAVGDLSVRTHTIVRPPELKKDVWAGDPLPGSAVTLAADEARLTGFVVEGAPEASVSGIAPDGTEVSFYPGAIATSPAHSGYRIDHNLIRHNALGIEATSDGGLPTRVDHNCLRENLWGLANQRFTLSNAVMDHNTSTKTTNFAYEVGWAVAPMESVTFDSNTSEDPSIPWRILASTDIAVLNNVIKGANNAIVVSRQNVEVLVAGNHITGSATSFRGIAVPGAAAPLPTPGTKGLRIVDNVVTGIRSSAGGIGISVAANSGISGATISGNTASNNSQSGILITAATSQVQGNVANGNGQFGIVGGPGSSGNLFTGNQMHGNVGYDARELGVNIWTDNDCDTDNVGGAICGTSP